MRPAPPMRYFGCGSDLHAWCGQGNPKADNQMRYGRREVGLFAIAARPVTEFGSADIDRFKVE